MFLSNLGGKTLQNHTQLYLKALASSHHRHPWMRSTRKEGVMMLGAKRAVLVSSRERTQSVGKGS